MQPPFTSLARGITTIATWTRTPGRTGSIELFSASCQTHRSISKTTRPAMTRFLGFMLQSNRWACLACGCILVVSSGEIYGFGAFATALSRDLSLNQSEQQLVGLCGNVGLWSGSFLGGVLADAKGPRLVMILSAFLLAAGYGGSAACATLGPTHSVLRDAKLVALLWLVVGIGSGLVYNATMFLNIKNWSQQHQALVVGLLATFFGLSSTIWGAPPACIHTCLRAPGICAYVHLCIVRMHRGRHALKLMFRRLGRGRRPREVLVPWWSYRR